MSIQRTLLNKDKTIIIAFCVKHLLSQLTLYTGENLQIAVSYLAIVMQSNSHPCILSSKDNNHQSKGIYEKKKKKPNLAQD